MNRLAAVPALIAFRARLASLWGAFRDPATPLLAKAVLVAAVAYLICPVDLLSDVMPIIGWLDDAAMIPLALSAFEKIASRRSR